MNFDINGQISKKLDERLRKQALEVSPAVMETEGKPVEKVVETEEVSASETAPISARSDKLAQSVERLKVVAERYGFRPFLEATRSVEQDFRDLKSGVDLIS